MPRERRRAALTRILRSGPIHTQEELVEKLAQKGFSVTQATISRDLAALGAVRGPQGYALPDLAVMQSRADNAELAASLRRHVVRVEPADSLVVVRTAPGHAGLIGAALDRRPPRGVVGTIAGDDTLFLATPSRAIAGDVTAFLRSLVDRTEQAA